jgi:hypothetical protein
MGYGRRYELLPRCEAAISGPYRETPDPAYRCALYARRQRDGLLVCNRHARTPRVLAAAASTRVKAVQQPRTDSPKITLW